MTGVEVRELRRSVGWGQVRLAAALGVDPSTVARWEQGRVEVSGLASLAVRAVIAEEAAKRKRQQNKP